MSWTLLVNIQIGYSSISLQTMELSLNNSHFPSQIDPTLRGRARRRQLALAIRWNRMRRCVCWSSVQVPIMFQLRYSATPNARKSPLTTTCLAKSPTSPSWSAMGRRASRHFSALENLFGIDYRLSTSASSPDSFGKRTLL